MTAERSLSPLAYTIQHYKDALDRLQASYTLEQLESWVMGIYHAMSGRSREFHRLEHVLDVARGLQPIQVIAALYHDTVYYQVDQGIVPELQEKLHGALTTRKGRFFIPTKVQDPKLKLVLEVFEFSPGHELTSSDGMNEFLSTVVAVQDVGALLNEAQLVTLIACIRATIPFRGLDSTGKSFLEQIAAAVERLARKRKWNWTAEQIDAIARQAVEVANADVANFGDEDLSAFLDNTWKLLPEANPALQTLASYTIRSYRTSIMQMERFMRQLSPEVVFHEYRGFPEKHVLAAKEMAAARNIKQAVLYLQAKLLSIATLEAIAELTGGDAPVILFTGSRENELSPLQINHFLEDPQCYRSRDFGGINESLFQLLMAGRVSSSSFDSRSSPLAAHIYAVLGESAFPTYVEHAWRAFHGKISWLDFLKVYSKPLIKDIIIAAGKISIVRSERCARLAEQI